MSMDEQSLDINVTSTEPTSPPIPNIIGLLERIVDMQAVQAAALGKLATATKGLSDSRAAVKPAVALENKLTLGFEDLVSSLSVSRRLIEREIDSGKFPRPDLRFGRRCLWRKQTILDWVNSPRGRAATSNAS
jgi:hypothetical protein